MSKRLDVQELERARAWAAARRFNNRTLAEAIGYSTATVYWLMLGLTAPTRGGRATGVRPEVWARFKLLCEAVDRRMRRLPPFNWEIE